MQKINGRFFILREKMSINYKFKEGYIQRSRTFFQVGGGGYVGLPEEGGWGGSRHTFGNLIMLFKEIRIMEVSYANNGNIYFS